MKIRSLLAPLLPLVLAAGSARAAAPAADTAERHFRLGRDAAKRGDFAQACIEFGKSEVLEPAGGTLLNLGDCEEHLGHAARAWQYFVEARPLLSPSDERTEIVIGRAAALEPRIARVVVRLAPGAPAGTRVQLGNAAVTLGRVSAFEPGPLALDVVGPGRPPRRVELKLQAGDVHEVALEPNVETTEPRASATHAVPADRPADGGVTRRTAGWIVGGIGVAGLAVGTVTGLLVATNASTYKEHCDASGCDPTGVAAESAGKTFQVASPVAFALGAACLGIGSYLLLTSDPRGVRAGIAPAPGGGTFLVGKSF